MDLKAVVYGLSVLCVCCVEKCVSFSNGSVAHSCASMMPGHKPYLPTTSRSPYNVYASAAIYRPGDIITVTMETLGNHSNAFQGFLLQARSREGQGVASGMLALGRFTNLNTTKFTVLTCNGIENSSVSQASSEQKTKVSVTWEAPSNSNYGDIYFSATFIQDYTTFWVQVNSTTISSGSADRINMKQMEEVLHGSSGSLVWTGCMCQNWTVVISAKYVFPLLTST